jgi:DNA-binding NarL/FixJ family response regulator
MASSQSSATSSWKPPTGFNQRRHGVSLAGDRERDTRPAAGSQPDTRVAEANEPRSRLRKRGDSLPRADGRLGWSQVRLTPTEERIATLVVGGHSNREIATGLRTTVAAVEAHLSRVYRKLWIRSRSELVVALVCAIACGHPVGDLEPSVSERAEVRREPLTRAEQHVADLASAGLTNQEIAGELGVSPATVETHVLHIYQKLSLRSRIELVQGAI